MMNCINELSVSLDDKSVYNMENCLKTCNRKMAVSIFFTSVMIFIVALMKVVSLHHHFEFYL